MVELPVWFSVEDLSVALCARVGRKLMFFNLQVCVLSLSFRPATHRLNWSRKGGGRGWGSLGLSLPLLLLLLLLLLFPRNVIKAPHRSSLRLGVQARFDLL